MQHLLPLLRQYDELGELEKIQFLTLLHQKDPYKWDYATMPESLQRFYDPKRKIGE